MLYSLQNGSNDNTCSKLNKEIGSKCMSSKCNYTHNVNAASVIKAVNKLKQKNIFFIIFLQILLFMVLLNSLISCPTYLTFFLCIAFLM